MRILFLCNKDPRNPKAGGATLELFRLMVLLREKGHHVTLLAGGFEGAPKRETLDGVEIIRLGNIFTIFLLAPLKLLRNGKNFDIVIDIALFGIPFSSRLYFPKTVLTICYHLPRETFKTELSHFGFFGRILASLAIKVEDKLYPIIYRSTPILTFSEATKRDLVSIGFPSTNIHLANLALAHVMVTNSFETNTIRKRMTLFGGPSKKRVPHMFVVLGRLRKYKGVQDAIRAMKELVNSYPEATLAVAGRGDYENNLRELTTELALTRNVQFMGYVSFETKVRLLREATALIMPSYKEGFPTPILEARACGTPIVASDAKGVYEYVTGHNDSFIFPVGNWRRMATLLNDVIEANGNARIENDGMPVMTDWEKNESEIVRYVESCLS